MYAIRSYYGDGDAGEKVPVGFEQIGGEETFQKLGRAFGPFHLVDGQETAEGVQARQ